MDHDLGIWLIILAAAIAVSSGIQLVVLVAWFLGARRLKAKMEGTHGQMRTKIEEIERVLRSHWPAIRETAAEVEAIVENLESVTGNLSELSRQFKDLASDATERTRKQLAHADQVVDELLARVGRTSAYLEQCVAGPLREIQAVSVGLRSALDVFFRRSNGAGRNRER